MDSATDLHTGLGSALRNNDSKKVREVRLSLGRKSSTEALATDASDDPIGRTVAGTTL